MFLCFETYHRCFESGVLVNVHCHSFLEEEEEEEEEEPEETEEVDPTTEVEPTSETNNATTDETTRPAEDADAVDEGWIAILLPIFYY